VPVEPTNAPSGSSNGTVTPAEPVVSGTPPPSDGEVPRRTPSERFRNWGVSLSSRLTAHPKLVLCVAAVVFVVAYAWQEILRYWAFKTYAWDLGLSNQAFYTTVFDHRFFFYTADLPSGFSGSLAIGTHFSPFLLLLLPFYVALPTASTLIVLQWIALALAAFPLYGLTKAETHSDKVAMALALLYLASPITAASGWYDFHPEAFIPVTVLASLYFYKLRRWGWFLGSWVLALSVTEADVLLLGIFAVSVVVGYLVLQRGGPLKSVFRRPEILFALVGLVVAILWLILAFIVVRSQNPGGGTFGADYGASWAILGASSIAQVIPTALLHPASASAALQHDGLLKVAYVLILLGSVGFLLFAGLLRYFFPIAAWVALAVLSNNSAYFSFGDQYTSYALPFLFAGTASGIALLIRKTRTTGSPNRPAPSRHFHFPRLRRWGSPAVHLVGRKSWVVVGIALIGILASTAVASPLVPSQCCAFDSRAVGLTSVTAHDVLLHQVIALIPPQAPVLTSNSIFPELSGRPNAFVVPFSSYFAGNRTFTGVLGQYVAEVDYILVDYTVDPTGAWAIASVANLSAFGVVVAAQGIVLYERGWTGSPAIWVPTVYTTPGGDLKGRGPSRPGSGPGEVILPPTPTTLSALSVPGFAEGTWLLYGPELGEVPPGLYRVTFNLTVLSNPTGELLGFVTNETPIKIQATIVNPSAEGRNYVITFPRGANQTLNATTLAVNTSSTVPTNYNITMTVRWSDPAVLFVNAVALAPDVPLILHYLRITQLSPS
jgi:uncharacterized membrane protein